MMIRLLVVLGLADMPAMAEVKIHDPLVSLLAKPYGVAKRIKLHHIDALHFGPGGGVRLVMTLENSGVKPVTLERPGFRLEVADAAGRWVDLGELSTPEIRFPVTPEHHVVRQTYVVDLKPALPDAEIVRLLRDSAQREGRIRLIGRSGMRVGRDGKQEFQRKNLKLELTGTCCLAKGFKWIRHRNENALPDCGLVE